MQNNNNADFNSLPIKPKVVAKHSNPVATKTTHVSVLNSNGFKTAGQLYAEQQPLFNPPQPIQRSGALVFPHPLDYIIEKNNNNLKTAEFFLGKRELPPKRKLQEFLSECSEPSTEDDLYMKYWRHRFIRKQVKLHNIRNRLRAVGLTNIQLSEELATVKVQVAGLKGANGALQFQNEELQNQLSAKMRVKEFRYLETTGMAVDDYLEDADDDELTPILEELFSDEVLHPEDVTPPVTSNPVVPNAPLKPLIVPTSSNILNSDPFPNGVPEVTPIKSQPHPLVKLSQSCLHPTHLIDMKYDEEHGRHA